MQAQKFDIAIYRGHNNLKLLDCVKFIKYKMVWEYWKDP